MTHNIQINHKFHLGVYAIILREKSILLVKKSRGPYTGKLDLPGGRPEHGETPLQTLIRETAEETGVKVYSAKLFDNYSIVVEHLGSLNVEDKLHHLGMIYFAIDFDDSTLVVEMINEDSVGAQWCSIDSLTKDMLSPFAYKAIIDIQKLY